MSTSTNPDAVAMSKISSKSLHLVMQTGIEGGFAPPIPTRRWIVSRPPQASDDLTISYKERPHGKHALEDKSSNVLKIEEHAASIARVLELLAEIPTQYPGAYDMYGRNTSIVLVTDHADLHQLDRYGSAAGAGIPHPTEEQKEKFNEAFDIISGWAKPN